MLQKRDIDVLAWPQDGTEETIRALPVSAECHPTTLGWATTGGVID